MHTIPCQNCKGHGTIAHFKHVENGLCFTCHGSGQLEATEAEYQEYIQELERKKQGSYILFNHGTIEYYKTTKQITEKYGTFYTGSYGKYSVHQSYKDEHIVYTNSTKNNDTFIQVVTAEYNRLIAEKIKKKINQYMEWILEEDDLEVSDMLSNKVRELRKQLKEINSK